MRCDSHVSKYCMDLKTTNNQERIIEYIFMSDYALISLHQMHLHIYRITPTHLHSLPTYTVDMQNSSFK